MEGDWSPSPLLLALQQPDGRAGSASPTSVGFNKFLWNLSVLRKFRCRRPSMSAQTQQELAVDVEKVVTRVTVSISKIDLSVIPHCLVCQSETANISCRLNFLNSVSRKMMELTA